MRMRTSSHQKVFRLCCCLLAGSALAADKYVSLTGSNTAPYETLATAANDVQTAVDAAAAGETVFVNDGTYVSAGPAGNNAMVDITKGITLKSINGAAAAILDGGGAGVGNRVLHVNHAAAVVDGLTLQNGFLTGGTQHGAGVWMRGGATVQNCVITNNANSSGNGGGVYLQSAGTLKDSTISSNQTTVAWKTGSGIDMTGGTVENCQIAGNTIASGFAYGGAVRMADGLITGCTVSGSTGATRGGGVHLSAGTLRDSTITDNVGDDGGGVYCQGTGLVQNCQITLNTGTSRAGGVKITDGVIELCTISNNNSGAHGGGVQVAGASLVDRCTISNNVGKWGAGVNMSGTAIVQNCTISNNAMFASGGAGGVRMESACTGQLLACTISGSDSHRAAVNVLGIATVSDCIIELNTALDFSAGVLLDRDGALVTHCQMLDNSASGDGGGLYAKAGTARNCLISGNSANRGGGVYFPGTACLVESCTIVGNSATLSGGVQGWNNVSGPVTNSIVWDNTPANYSWSTPVISYTNTSPLPAGTGNISSDPLFVNAGGGDYRLTAASPAIGAGQNEAWMASGVDLDGNPRIADTTVDMGAYELPPPTCNCAAATSAAYDALCALVVNQRLTSIDEVAAELNTILDSVLPANGCDLNDPCRAAILAELEF